MKILAIAQVENEVNLLKEINKQTIQPDQRFFFIDNNPTEGINARRARIAKNHQKLVKAVEHYKPDFVWQLEQDSVLPEDCLERLIERFKQLISREPLGYVSGIQVGRHGIYAIGAWHIPPERDTFQSVDHRLEGLQEVDATGMYCLLAPTDVWLKGNCFWKGEPWGPDVNWGLSLREKGYKIYADMDLHIGHRSESRGTIMPKTLSNVNVRFYKDENGKWKYKTS